MLIGHEELKVITDTRNLLDELLETQDILADPESMKKLAQANEHVKKGRIHAFTDL